MIDVRTNPDRYHHWTLKLGEQIAELVLDVDEHETVGAGYQLKMNSYDLGVDIELADALERLRLSYPQITTVLVRSAKERVFCAGANIGMLAGATHQHKVNFCKFTNETRLFMEDTPAHFIAVIEGTAAGGGYELALSCDTIVLVDDGSASVSLPEVALLAVLPGTGGLTRLTDKRNLRRDRADYFCTLEEGIKGQRALAWRLVDHLVPRSGLSELLDELVISHQRTGPPPGPGITLNEIPRELTLNSVSYSHIQANIDRSNGVVTIEISGPTEAPSSSGELLSEGDNSWLIATARELNDLICHLRFNESTLGTLLVKSRGDLAIAKRYTELLERERGEWIVDEGLALWRRTLARLDLTSRSIMAAVDSSSCFVGPLAELVFASDRSFFLDDAQAGLVVTRLNLEAFPMMNGLSRLATRFWGHPDELARLESIIDHPLDAATAQEFGLVTFTPDTFDWEDELRLALDGRNAFSPDALTAMEANLRFAGPESMATKIFGRLSAWQNWVFNRPNAVGPEGALQRYGTGLATNFQSERI
ncbi:enoyl-CoA hydratase/isomerase family protein [Ferrimicrobium sp.]|uniref:enoyl-CoA hydratase/isomerase family protein n=1 Tax=Ferrimicrobium sp. TaxID=2926050 RepID=UPI00260DE610|nr:enoyl-CoA hydratase/isomerase family protein [Ferrimicrobium sp.]